jgi:predicted transposase/invertase (TIGR01784 family)
MRPGIDPTVDYAFKKLFGSERNHDLLLSLLNAILQPSLEEILVGIEILNPFNDKETSEDKLSIVDIKARDLQGRQYHIEMQMLAPWFLTKRVLYYWAKYHQTQLLEGVSYRDLKPTITICFVNDVLYPELSEHQHAFQLWDGNHKVVFSEDLLVYLIELPKFQKTAEQVRGLLEVWTFFLRHAAGLDSDNLPATLDLPPIHLAMRELIMLTQSELERERYEARQRVIREMVSMQEESHARAEEARRAAEEARRAAEEVRRAAEQIRRAEEQTRAAQQERLEEITRHILFCQRLLKEPLTPWDDLVRLPLERLRELAEALERRLSPPE